MTLPSFVHRVAAIVPFLGCAEAQEAPPSRPAREIASLREEAKRLLESGDPAKAAEFARGALERDGGALETRLVLAQALLADRRTNDALDALDAAKRQWGESPDLLYEYARAFLAKAESLGAEGAGNFSVFAVEDASAALRKVLEAQPRRLEAALLLAKARLSIADLDGADAALDAAAATSPEAPGLEPVRATIRFQRYLTAKQEGAGEDEVRRLYGEALAAFEVARRSDPEDAGAARGLGDLYLWEGKKGEAAAAYEDALALDPASVDLAAVVPLLDDDRALRMVRRAAERYAARRPSRPDADAPLHWYEGWLRFRRGEFEKARAALDESVRKDPSFSNAHYYGGLAAYELKDYEGAERAFVALVRAGLEPAVEVLLQDEARRGPLEAMLLYLADRAARAGREEAARDLFRSVAGISPENVDAWNNFAFLARNTGRAEDAVEGYRRALELRPEDPQLLNALAVVLHYNLAQDLEEARSLYERAIAAADAVLANRDASEVARREAATAKSDAERNLTRLKEGDRRPW